MIDTFGVPEFFVTDIGDIEDAGSGNVRIVRCIKRGGVLIPVFSLVTPLVRMIPDATYVRDAAIAIFNGQQVEEAAHRH